MGTWRVYSQPDAPATTLPMVTMRFWSNGHCQEYLGDRPIFGPAMYWVENGKLHWKARRPVSPEGFRQFAQDLSSQWETGGRVPVQETIYDIIEIGPDRIVLRLQRPEGVEEDYLPRLPDSTSDQ